jgi:hypothetical protein
MGAHPVLSLVALLVCTAAPVLILGRRQIHAAWDAVFVKHYAGLTREEYEKLDPVSRKNFLRASNRAKMNLIPDTVPIEQAK